MNLSCWKPADSLPEKVTLKKAHSCWCVCLCHCCLLFRFSGKGFRLGLSLWKWSGNASSAAHLWHMFYINYHSFQQRLRKSFIRRSVCWKIVCADSHVDSLCYYAVLRLRPAHSVDCKQQRKRRCFVVACTKSTLNPGVWITLLARQFKPHLNN